MTDTDTAFWCVRGDIAKTERRCLMVYPEEFRQLMSQFATGVCIVSATDDTQRPRALTVNSLMSACLNPPTIVVGIARSSDTYPVLERSGYLGISILSGEQAWIAKRLATKASDKCDGVPFIQAPHGIWVIDNALGYVICQIRDQHAIGDHDLFVVTVTHVHCQDGAPLVFYARNFWPLQGSASRTQG